MLDWLRLQDQFDALEARRSGSQSRGPALCQALGRYDGGIGTSGNQPSSNSGCFPLPSPGMDATGWQTGACIPAIKELNRK